MNGRIEVSYLNTTGASDVRFTVAQAFRYVVPVGNFVAASDAPFDLTAEERLRKMLAFDAPWGSQNEALTASVLKTLSGLASTPLEDEGAALRARHDLKVVTDDNMATEFKSDWKLFDPQRSWRRLGAHLFRNEM